MPLCSDEIYWGKIATTNLPLRPLTTIIYTYILSIYRTSFTKLQDKTRLHQGSKQESGKKVTDCFSSKCASVYPAMYLHCAFRQTSSHTAI